MIIVLDTLEDEINLIKQRRIHFESMGLAYGKINQTA